MFFIIVAGIKLSGADSPESLAVQLLLEPVSSSGVNFDDER